MKKKLFLVTLSILFTYFSYAQTPSWLWAKGAGGSSIDVGNSVATDANGNVYVAGWFNSWPITFGTDTLFTTGAYDMFLTKYDAEGLVLWAKSIGGSGNPSYELDDRAYSVTIDATGNVYVAGTFTSPFIVFGSDTLTKAGSYYTDADVFLAKYDSSGNELWARSGAGGSGINYAYSVSADAYGNVYLAGTFASSTITFNTTTLSNRTLFLTKYNYAGDVIWAQSSSGNITGAISINAHATGNIYLVGTFYGNSITFGSTTLSHTGGLGYHMFLLKYDSGGNIMWAKGENGNFDDYGYSVTTDPSGNVYVAGAFLSSTIVFDSYVLTNTATAPSYDSFLVKYNANGSVAWAKSADGTSGASWPGSNDKPFAVTTDVLGDIYVAGAFLCTTITFGSTILTNNNGSGYADIYIVKYNASGNVLGAKSAGGNSEDYAYSISVDGLGNVYITGSYVSPEIFFGTDTLTNTSYNQDIFLAKLDGTLITGSNELMNQGESFTLYPNPASDNVTLNLTLTNYADFTLNIYDLIGKLVCSEKFQQSQRQINLSHLKRGIYIVEIKFEGKTENRKLIIQR